MSLKRSRKGTLYERPPAKRYKRTPSEFSTVQGFMGPIPKKIPRYPGYVWRTVKLGKRNYVMKDWTSGRRYHKTFNIPYRKHKSAAISGTYFLDNVCISY